ncbi:DNA/RNA helicase domain-containing protein, partial [Staphylococcus pasteuri_A]
HFRDHYVGSTEVPFEKVVVFDEAQRAWTSDQASKFMQTKRGQTDFDMSEPEFLISVMDRHEDWCTIVCLIGGGQEINTGEAGLAEWLTALQQRFPDWQVNASDLL